MNTGHGRWLVCAISRPSQFVNEKLWLTSVDESNIKFCLYRAYRVKKIFSDTCIPANCSPHFYWVRIRIMFIPSPPNPPKKEKRCVHDIHYSLTWLKKRIKLLGLHRRGQHVCYTPVSVVKAAIHVSTTSIL